MESILAPICLFVYNRPRHTEETIQALLANTLAARSEIFIYSDGAKDEADRQRVNEVRKIIHSIVGFKNVYIIESTRNQGLANSIVTGVTQVLEKYGKIIVLEDDIVTSRYFLEFLNDSLSLYFSDESVASIHAYVYPIEDLPDAFFLKGADCWGWATWSRSWCNYEPNGTKLLAEIKSKELEREIDFNNSANYIKMLKHQIKGKNDSWAIRWHLSCYLKNKYTLYPGKTFVRNIGNDSTGQHSTSTKIFDSEVTDNYEKFTKIDIVENIYAKNKFEYFYNSHRQNTVLKLFKHLVKKIV